MGSKSDIQQGWGGCVRAALLVAEIEQRIADAQLCVKTLTRRLGISNSYLREVVRMNCGISLGMLIETVRLAHAVDLMMDAKGQTLYEISKTVGYLSARTFREAFKRRLGMSPSECMRLLHENDERCREAIAELGASLRSAQSAVLPRIFRQIFPADFSREKR
ncbi:MAG: helix-turn-helix domain-containing protein [Bacteroidota bacterium]